MGNHSFYPWVICPLDRFSSALGYAEPRSSVDFHYIKKSFTLQIKKPASPFGILQVREVAGGYTLSPTTLFLRKIRKPKWTWGISSPRPLLRSRRYLHAYPRYVHGDVAGRAATFQSAMTSKTCQSFPAVLALRISRICP